MKEHPGFHSYKHVVTNFIKHWCERGFQRERRNVKQKAQSAHTFLLQLIEKVAHTWLVIRGSILISFLKYIFTILGVVNAVNIYNVYTLTNELHTAWLIKLSLPLPQLTALFHFLF